MALGNLRAALSGGLKSHKITAESLNDCGWITVSLASRTCLGFLRRVELWHNSAELLDKNSWSAAIHNEFHQLEVQHHQWHPALKALRTKPQDAPGPTSISSLHGWSPSKDLASKMLESLHQVHFLNNLNVGSGLSVGALNFAPADSGCPSEVLNLQFPVQTECIVPRDLGQDIPASQWYHSLPEIQL